MLDRYNLDQSTADGVLVWLEVYHCPEGPSISDNSLEVLGRTARINSGRTYAVIFGGPDLKPLYPIIFGQGVGSIYHVRDKGSECYDSNVYSITLCDIIDRTCPAAVLLPSSERGNQLGEKIAAMLGAELYADCTGIDMDGRVISTVPAPLNQFMMSNRKKFPQVATVKKGAYPMPENKEGQGTAFYWQTWKER
jgi:electron transfer flavoprotein alpha subunit